MSVAPSSSHQDQHGPGGQPGGKEDLHYNSHLEELIASEAEKALALRWLHDQSEKRYSQLNTYIAIPVICISGRPPQHLDFPSDMGHTKKPKNLLGLTFHGDQTTYELYHWFLPT